MKTTRIQTSRRGQGVFLALATVTLAALLFATAVRLDWSSRALEEAGDGAGSAVAEQLALSAVAEALWRVQTEGNQPGTTLFGNLRRGLRENRGPVDLSKELRPEALVKSLKNPEYNGAFDHCTFESFSAVLRPKDAPDVLRVTCTVGLDRGAGSTVRKTAKEERRWGLNGIFAPQPLDQLTVGMLKVDVLSEHVRTLGRWQDAVQQYNRWLEDYQALLEQVRGLPFDGDGKATFRVMPQYFTWLDFVGFTGDEQAVLEAQRQREPWREKERILDEWHHKGGTRGLSDTHRADVWYEGQTPLKFDIEKKLRFQVECRSLPWLTSSTIVEAEQAANALIALGEQVDLNALDPNKRFHDALERSLTALGKGGAKVMRLNATTARNAAEREQEPDGGVLRYVQNMNRALVEMEEALRGGTDALNGYTRAMLGETRAPLTPPEGSGGTVHPRVGAVLDTCDLKDWMKHFSGANGSLTLKLSRQDQEKRLEILQQGKVPPPVDVDVENWEGKSLIDFNHLDVKVNRLTAREPGRDRVLLRCGPLQLAGGQVQAGVYAEDVVTKAPTIISGALVVGRHPMAERDDDRGFLSGSVVHDARMLAGTFVDAEDKNARPDWHRVCDESYIFILDPQGWSRDVRRGKGHK